MKIITYSDLHLEFSHDWLPARDVDGDVMILAGDIISFKDYKPLSRLLDGWEKPVLYVAGNHEYYTQRPIDRENEDFKSWLADNHPNVHFLLDEAVEIDGVSFFGGTMWTNFNNANPVAMHTAQQGMNDFRLILNPDGSILKPSDTVELHNQFTARLLDWFRQDMKGPRVVITHHAPVVNPNTQYRNSPLMPAFNSLDMIEVIETYQPALWVYGHTHECDHQVLGQTKVISNQLGYPRGGNIFEAKGFDKDGLPTQV